MSELDGMRTLLCVVETGSFSAAARRLGTTQPSVSRAVAALEADLGATLLVRTTRRISLTEAGERYVQIAARALALLDEARATARDATSSVRGRLRITAPVSFGTAWLAVRLPELRRAHPELEIALDFTEQHVDLVEAGVDLGIRIGGPERAELVGRRVGRIERRLVASPAWVERHGRPRAPSDLERAHGLVFTSSAAWSGWELEWRGRTQSLRPASTTRATSGDFLRVLAIAGEGIALLPDWLLIEPLAEGRLVDLFPDARFPGLDLWLVWPSQRHQSAAARSFVEWFVERARETWPASPISRRDGRGSRRSARPAR